MLRPLLATLILATTSLACAAEPEAAAPAKTKDAPQPAAQVVIVDTSKGAIEITLDAAKAPKSVENFLRYVDAGHYDGTVFHRVISGFMIQGGGFDAKLTQKSTGAPVENEADNGLKNRRGTLAMARTSDPHSATAQFFINHTDNAFLDHTAKTMRGWGYAVFGQVSAGLEVVDAIAAVPTGPGGPFRSDVPQEPVLIKSIRRK